MSLHLLEDKENKFLGRREISARIQGLAGKLNRQNAQETLASFLKVNKDDLYIVKISSSAGTRDLVVSSLYYADKDRARRQLPPYLFTRILPKEQRAKLKEQRKKEEKPAVKPKK